MLDCTNKAWSYKDVMRGILTGAFVPVGGEQLPTSAIKMVAVEDSGEDYFETGNLYNSFDKLAKELSGLYSDEFPELALRVSLGTVGAETDRCAHPGRVRTELEMFLATIGKGTDGKPLIRLAISGMPVTESGSGS
jgi:hypothetical protein